MLETNHIAILMAAYNGEGYIEEQIGSLLAQSESGWELFIHDDGSTDRTPELIRRCAQAHPQRIHIVDGAPCGGAKENFFYLMEQVRAPYLMFCDQDDVWLPDKIERTFGRMKELEKTAGRETPLLVFTDLRVTDGALNPLAERMSVYQKLDPRRIRAKDLMIQNVITGCTVMINRALEERAIEAPDREAVIMHDWWCALLAADFGEISYVDLPLVLYRQHGSNSVGAKNIRSRAYLLAKLMAPGKIKSSLLATRRQTDAFVRAYGAADPVLRRYGALGAEGKARRLWFYARHGVRKSGWQRNLGLFIWG